MNVTSGALRPRTRGQLSSRATLRVLRAAVAAIRPRGHGFDQPIDADVLAQMQEFFPFLPAPMRFAFPLGLRLLEYGPPLFAQRWTRFSSMPVEDARAYLEAFQRAGDLRAAMVVGLRALVFLAFYQHPTVLADLGVDWAGRAASLTRRRAELLANEPGR
jgi:hypothetical protein